MLFVVAMVTRIGAVHDRTDRQGSYDAHCSRARHDMLDRHDKHAAYDSHQRIVGKCPRINGHVLLELAVAPTAP